MDKRRQAFGEHRFHLITGEGAGDKDIAQHLFRCSVPPHRTPRKFRQAVKIKSITPIHQRDRHTVHQRMTRSHE